MLTAGFLLLPAMGAPGMRAAPPAPAASVGPTGALLWTLQAGGPSQSGIVPGLALGPGGVLAVTGTDGVLRLYR